MSLSTAGVWRGGVWATTVWRDQVWYEPNRRNPGGGGGRVYPYPSSKPKPKRTRQPKPVEPYEVSGPLNRTLEHPQVPQWDQEAWEASLKTLVALEAEQRVRERAKRQKASETALIIWLLQ